MRSISCDLVPARNIERCGQRWTSLSDEPWFRLGTREPLAGRWIRIRWRSGLLDPVCRPVLRFHLRSAVVADYVLDSLAGAAIFGRNEWIGFVPAETTAIGLSPVNCKGDFGFEIEDMVIMGLLDLWPIVFRRAPGLGFLALGAGMIGRAKAITDIVRDALAIQPLTTYDRWRKNRLRPFEAAGLDGGLDAAAARRQIRFIVAFEAPDDGCIAALVSDLSGQVAVNSAGVGNWSLIIVAPPEYVDSLRPLAAVSSSIRLQASPATLADLSRELNDDDLIAILPTGARLSATTVPTVLAAAARNPGTDVFCGDHDHVDAMARRCKPIFLPGFDPVLQSQCDVMGPAAFWRLDALKLPDSQDTLSDRALPALVASPKTVQVLSRVLMTLPTDLAPVPPVAVRQGVSGQIAASDAPDLEATVIIPTRDRLDLLRPCIEGILKKTEGRYRVIIVDNGSSEPKTKAYFDLIGQDERVLVASMAGPFNFSRLCNEAAALATSQILVFVNNDTEIIRGDWLRLLMHHAVEPDVGAVGAKLLYPSGKVQHSGVIVGKGGQAGHFELGGRTDDPGYFGRAQYTHRLSAVTGACLAVERRKFYEVGGFDAENLPIDLNDIDLCLRLNDKGYFTLYVPDCVLIHHESASRGRSIDIESKYARERAYFRQRWLKVTRADPHFSPSLTLYSEPAMLG